MRWRDLLERHDDRARAVALLDTRHVTARANVHLERVLGALGRDEGAIHEAEELDAAEGDDDEPWIELAKVGHLAVLPHQTDTTPSITTLWIAPWSVALNLTSGRRRAALSESAM